MCGPPATSPSTTKLKNKVRNSACFSRWLKLCPHCRRWHCVWPHPRWPRAEPWRWLQSQHREGLPVHRTRWLHPQVQPIEPGVRLCGWLPQPSLCLQGLGTWAYICPLGLSLGTLLCGLKYTLYKRKGISQVKTGYQPKIALLCIVCHRFTD